MRKLMSIAAVFCVASSLCLAEGMSSLGLYGSYVDSDDLEEGYGAGAKLKLGLLEILSLEARGAWVQFDLDDADFEIDMIPVEGALLLNIPLADNIIPYAGAGAGYYFFDADEVDLDDAVGFFALAGLELWLSEDMGLFGEVRWLWLEADVDASRDEFEDLDDDEVNADGLGVNVGLLIKL